VQRKGLLQSEYQLASKSQIYIVFELSEKQILIKARGVVLKKLPIESFSFWGAPVPSRAVIVQSKTSILRPQRAEVKPKQNDEENPAEPQAIQVEDMPARFCLHYDGGIDLYIRPKSEGGGSTILNLLSLLKSYLIIRPFGTLWNQLHQENFTEIVLYLKEKDAKFLYWSSPEGIPCIIGG
jgi:hypothetical protein